MGIYRVLVLECAVADAGEGLPEADGMVIAGRDQEHAVLRAPHPPPICGSTGSYWRPIL